MDILNKEKQTHKRSPTRSLIICQVGFWQLYLKKHNNESARRLWAQRDWVTKFYLDGLLNNERSQNWLNWQKLCDPRPERRFPIYQSYLGVALHTCTQLRPWTDEIKSIFCGIFSKSQISAISQRSSRYQAKWKCRDEEATFHLHISSLLQKNGSGEKK